MAGRRFLPAPCSRSLAAFRRRSCGEESEAACDEGFCSGRRFCLRALRLANRKPTNAATRRQARPPSFSPSLPPSPSLTPRPVLPRRRHALRRRQSPQRRQVPRRQHVLRRRRVPRQRPWRGPWRRPYRFRWRGPPPFVLLPRIPRGRIPRPRIPLPCALPPSPQQAAGTRSSSPPLMPPLPGKPPPTPSPRCSASGCQAMGPRRQHKRLPRRLRLAPVPRLSPVRPNRRRLLPAPPSRQRRSGRLGGCSAGAALPPRRSCRP